MQFARRNSFCFFTLIQVAIAAQSKAVDLQIHMPLPCETLHNAPTSHLATLSRFFSRLGAFSDASALLVIVGAAALAPPAACPSVLAADAPLAAFGSEAVPDWSDGAAAAVSNDGLLSLLPVEVVAAAVADALVTPASLAVPPRLDCSAALRSAVACLSVISRALVSHAA